MRVHKKIGLILLLSLIVLFNFFVLSIYLSTDPKEIQPKQALRVLDNEDSLEYISSAKSENISITETSYLTYSSGRSSSSSSPSSSSSNGIISPDNECGNFGFDFGVSKWVCDGAWGLDEEIYPGTSVTGSCDEAFWDIGSSNADGVVIKSGNIDQGEYYYSEDGITGTINLLNEISYISFCGYYGQPDCGNNIINQDEECDLGNNNGNQCISLYDESCTYCSSDCKNITLTRFCGDNNLDPEEECDDGNLINGDGCDFNCELEECCDDEDCPEDSYSDNYCYNFNVYRNLTDNFCQNESCLFEIIPELFINCGNETYSDEYCYDGDVYQNHTIPGCEQGSCTLSSDFHKIDECGEDSCGDWGDYICEGKNKTRTRACYDKGCEQANCFSDEKQEKESEECAYGCVGGTCTHPVCGNQVLELGEECDDGNLFNSDGCSENCTLEICEHDVGIRYSYENSFGTGIAIKPDSTDDWLEDLVELAQNQNYIVKYIIDNKIENTTNNIHVIVAINTGEIIGYREGIDNEGRGRGGGRGAGEPTYIPIYGNTTILADYNTSINQYHIGEVDLNTTEIVPGTYNISVYVEKINEIDCNMSDNYAERQITIIPLGSYCSDNNLDLGEECDDGNLINGDGCDENCEIEEIVCSEHGDCGENQCAGGPNYCDNNNVYQDFIIYACINPGQYNSYCTDSIVPWLLQICKYECNNGVCI